FLLARTPRLFRRRPLPQLCRRVIELAPATAAEAKKKAAPCAAFPFRRQARPASLEIILDFGSYAKSPAERFRQDRHYRIRPWAGRPRIRARVDRWDGACPRGRRARRDRRVHADRLS